jgi:hypothetical protein
VQEDDGVPTAELGEHRFKAGVAEIDAAGVRHQGHAVRAQMVEGVRDLVERAVDVR